MRIDPPPVDPSMFDIAWQPHDLPRLLADAARAPARPEAALLLGDLDIPSLTGVALVHAIAACQRLASWVDATQQALLAALARPGVAVPVERVLDAARWSAAKPGELFAPDDVLDTADDPVRDPRCANAVAYHAARFASMEVAAALHLSPLAARIRVERALALTDRMPNTLAALRAGDIDLVRAGILADGTASLSPEVRAAAESHVLAAAGSRTPAQLRARVAWTILRLDPDGAADRAKGARKRRDVYLRPEPDDLATVGALMGADKAAKLIWLLNTMAGSDAGPGDTRGIGERRVDALTDIVDDLVSTGVVDIRPIIGATGADLHVPDPARCDRYRPTAASTIPPSICLTVHVAASTLAGCDDWPAELAGQGAITAGLARELARAATTAHAVVADTGPSSPSGLRTRAAPWPSHAGANGLPRGCGHPGCTGGETCGSTLDHGEDRYRPPAKVADYVVDRDRCCRFPGCRMPATRCDLDHQIPYERGGSTCPCNLRPLCRAHHLAKTFTGWTYTATPDGTTSWTSPLGLPYTDPPEGPVLAQILHAGAGPGDDGEPPF